MGQGQRQALRDAGREGGAFVVKIYAVAHFQANIEKQKLYKGGPQR